LHDRPLPRLTRNLNIRLEAHGLSLPVGFLAVDFLGRGPPGTGWHYSLCSIFFLISQHRIGREKAIGLDFLQRFCPPPKDIPA
ncbi:hypothetical protein, partial [Pararhodobacter sp.]|uniref:hypothetical protein n=1 Tax=Pararhodobacter sp. TaxID=2127056 RepID=UPI002FE07D0E